MTPQSLRPFWAAARRGGLTTQVEGLSRLSWVGLKLAPSGASVGWLCSLTTSATWVDGLTSTAGTSSAGGESSRGGPIGDGSGWLSSAVESALGPYRCRQGVSSVKTVASGGSPADAGTTRSGEVIFFNTRRVADPFTSDCPKGGESNTLSGMTRFSLTSAT